MIKSTLIFMRRAMRKGNKLKSKVSDATVIAVLAFAIAIFTMVIGLLIALTHYKVNTIYYTYHQEEYVFADYDMYEDDYKGLLFVNSPDSFIGFLEKQPESKHFEYRLANMDAPYDFVTVGEMMHHEHCCVAVVFPENSNELLDNDDPLDALTYVRTDNLMFTDAELFLEDFLKAYNEYLTTEKGYPQVTIQSSDITITPVSNSNYDNKLIGLIGIAPLIIFIIILYSTMTSGTNVIAGEKERGTFAAVILTPVPRSSVIVGNVLGISVLSSIPAAAVCLIAFGFNRFNIPGLIVSLLLVCSFAIFIASVTILISVINQSVVSAQTAFLPIFLIILGIAFNSIQQLGAFNKSFLYFPIYGHFFGLGNAMAAGHGYYRGYIPAALVCVLITLLISVGIMMLSTKLLKNEKFMTNEGGLSAKEIRKSKKQRQSFDIGPMISHALFPVIVLSVVQMLALIPTAISYMGNSQYSNFIRGLKDVTEFKDLIKVTTDILAKFLSDPMFLISMTLGYVLLVAIYCLKIFIFERDKHPLQSMGFKGEHRLFKYLIGLVLGFGLLTSVCLILIATGNLEFHGFAVNSSNVWIILSGIPMWFIQGASEEIMFRGYMIPRLEKKYNNIFAVIYSSFLFALLHGANIGFTFLAGFNLFIIAIFFALLYLYTDSLWLTCAAHTAWNFCQGSLYGLEVSGSESGASIVASSYTSNASSLFTGGAFGPEGGLAVTAVTVVGIVIISFLLWKKSRKNAQNVQKVTAL